MKFSYIYLELDVGTRYGNGTKRKEGERKLLQLKPCLKCVPKCEYETRARQRTK